MPLHHLKQESDLDTLKANNKKVIVDCFAEWCGPCQLIGPKFEAWAQKYPNVKFAKVDVEEAEELAEILQVESIPTFYFFENGKQVDKIIGGEVSKIEPKVEQFCSQ